METTSRMGSVAKRFNRLMEGGQCNFPTPIVERGVVPSCYYFLYSRFVYLNCLVIKVHRQSDPRYSGQWDPVFKELNLTERARTSNDVQLSMFPHTCLRGRSGGGYRHRS